MAVLTAEVPQAETSVLRPAPLELLEIQVDQRLSSADRTTSHTAPAARGVEHPSWTVARPGHTGGAITGPTPCPATDGSETRTLREVSEALGISQERARQVEMKALRTIRTGRYAGTLRRALSEAV